MAAKKKIKMSSEARARCTTMLYGSDETNPDFLFQGTCTALLLLIADGAIDPVKAARQELADRGLNQNGEWVGFYEAKRTWGVSPR